MNNDEISQRHEISLRKKMPFATQCKQQKTLKNLAHRNHWLVKIYTVLAFANTSIYRRKPRVLRILCESQKKGQV
jgi:hypothetical protein